MERDEKSWQQYIDTVAFTYNTKINKATHLKPFKVFIGRPAKLPIDLIIPKPQNRYENEAVYDKDTLLWFDRMYKLAYNNTEARFWWNARG